MSKGFFFLRFRFYIVFFFRLLIIIYDNRVFGVVVIEMVGCFVLGLVVLFGIFKESLRYNFIIMGF